VACKLLQRMSTEKAAAKRRLSSEGTRIEPGTANLDHEQQQQQQPHQQTQQQQTHRSQQQPSHAAQRETSSEAADKENVKEPAASASRVAGVPAYSTPGSLKPPPIAASATIAGNPEDSTVTVAARGSGDAPPRQVIAVSASKSPAAFFNLARKFLVTNEMCDLSALEGAIVSAVDAAHLLERSQLASIVRYVDTFAPYCVRDSMLIDFDLTIPIVACDALEYTPPTSTLSPSDESKRR
jgi:hypothetical protein